MYVSFESTPHREFGGLLKEVVREYFGTLTNFLIVPPDSEVNVYMLNMNNIMLNPMFSYDYHLKGFLELLDAAVEELQHES